ncbi:MAG: (Fe-S)-binding protein, partial [Smithella sp.]
MAHHNIIKANSYDNLARRLNIFPQGAPPTEFLFKILKVLFSEREARLVSVLPVKPFTDQKAAAIWKLNLNEAEVVLNDLADRGILLDYENDGKKTYLLPPPMAGFFEFSLMRYRKDIDQRFLSELFYQYLNIEEDFIKALFVDGETQLGRVFVNESVLSNENALHVLDYEKASEVIKTASQIGIGVCYCR